jgi:hypothetical protein
VEIWCEFFDESKVEFKKGLSYCRTFHHFAEIHSKINVSWSVRFESEAILEKSVRNPIILDKFKLPKHR